MLTDPQLKDIGHALVQVGGVVAVALGGSRARGEHTPESDADLGLYYEEAIDVAALGRLAREVGGPDAEVTEHGEWGPWVDGGAWLRIDGVAVDWIYRDLDRVVSSWEEARAGRYRFHAQVGHPLGVPDFAYCGEVAHAVVLADPDGRLRDLREQVAIYPPALSAALAQGLWEAQFCIAIARKAVSRHDTTYVAGCLFRVVLLCAHALHGKAGRWLINEKGAVAAAGQLAIGPTDFTARAHLLMQLGESAQALREAIEAAAELLSEVTSICGGPTQD